MSDSAQTARASRKQDVMAGVLELSFPPAGEPYNVDDAKCFVEGLKRVLTGTFNPAGGKTGMAALAVKSTDSADADTIIEDDLKKSQPLVIIKSKRRWLRTALIGWIFVIGYLTSPAPANQIRDNEESIPGAAATHRYSPAPDGIVDGREWSEIDIGALFGPPIQTRGKGLVVVPGHGANPKRTEIIRNNTQHIPFDRFDCVVFVYADIDNNTQNGLDLGECKAVRKKGGWVDFQYMIKPSLVKAAGYTTVTLMLDDVRIAPPNLLADNGYHLGDMNMLDRMHFLLETHGLGSISPNVYASDKAEMYLGLGPIHTEYDPPKLSVVIHPEGFIELGTMEIQLAMFHMTDVGWPCFHSLLDPERNPTGWGHDMCYKKFCNATVGLADAVVIHYGRPTVYSDLPGTIDMPYKVSMRQMYTWAARYRKNHAHFLSDWPEDGIQVVKRCKSSLYWGP